jgi:NADPH2:quinone reductase
MKVKTPHGLVFERNGEPLDVVSWRELPSPELGPDEVLVRMRLSPVHPSNLHVIRGRFGRQPALPASPGSEGFGIVEAVGAGVSQRRVGDRVVLLDCPGTWREVVVCPAGRAVPVPDRVSDDDAAQALINPVTAWVMTVVEHKLRRGDWLVQTAAGSTVGRLVLQIAKAQGFHTINLVRRREQIDEIKQLGGEVVICTEDENWPEQLMEATGGRGVTRAIDCVAGRVGATVARCLAPGGRMLVYGALSSHRQSDPTAFEMPIFAPRLVYSAAEVRGWFQPHWLETTDEADSYKALESMLELMASGAVKLPPAQRYPASAYREALIAADGNSREGKPLLEFSRE